MSTATSDSPAENKQQVSWSRKQMEKALAHHQAGRLKEAEEYYRQVLRLEPNEADANNLLGVLLFQSKRAQDGLGYLSTATKVKPTEAMFFYNYAIALRAAGKADEAAGAFAKCVELDPQHADSQLALADYYLKRKRFDQAIGVLQKFVNLKPMEASGFKKLGDALHRLWRSFDRNSDSRLQHTTIYSRRLRCAFSRYGGCDYTFPLRRIVDNLQIVYCNVLINNRNWLRMSSIIEIENLSKVYAGGFQAVDRINLSVEKSEILALLGPNGAGKTTLISMVCGIVNPTSGKVRVDGHDIIEGYRHTRSIIGLVPQELTTDSFETVWDTVTFSRGLFGKKANPDFIEQTLKSLSLWDKKDHRIMELSGGMKRRVMIAKALSHEPRVLFLDEPTAGVDVALRKDMWDLVSGLRDSGVTVILTTHYIEEAEEIADRIGVIDKGQLVLVEDKEVLMRKLGKKQLILDLKHALDSIPDPLKAYDLALAKDGHQLVYTYDTAQEHTGIAALLKVLSQEQIQFKDLKTDQSSLEDIFVSLLKESA